MRHTKKLASRFAFGRDSLKESGGVGIDGHPACSGCFSNAILSTDSQYKALEWLFSLSASPAYTVYIVVCVIQVITLVGRLLKTDYTMLRLGRGRVDRGSPRLCLFCFVWFFVRQKKRRWLSGWSCCCFRWHFTEFFATLAKDSSGSKSNRRYRCCATARTSLSEFAGVAGSFWDTGTSYSVLYRLACDCVATTVCCGLDPLSLPRNIRSVCPRWRTSWHLLEPRFLLI